MVMSGRSVHLTTIFPGQVVNQYFVNTLSLVTAGIQFAVGHSPKIVPDVREFAVQFGQFV